MASQAEMGHEEPPVRGLMLPFVLLAAVFGAVEYVIESIPGFLFVRLQIDSQSPSVLALYNNIDAAVRVTLVPFVLFLAFYLLARRSGIDLRRSYLAVALSIFVGTALVFLPIDIGQSAVSTPLPGFTPLEAAVESVGGAFGSSLNHAFIGFSAVFLWGFINRPPGSRDLEPTEVLHGTEDVSIVGVVMVAVYVWEYLAQAYQAMYPLSSSNELATIFASVLGGGSPLFYTFAIWQQAVLLMMLPFALFFLIARRQGLNPYVQGRKIAVVILLWGLFLRAFTSFFYVYIARVFDPSAFPGATLASTLAGEFAPMDLLGIVASTLNFLFLGITAVVFAYYSRGGSETAPSQVPAASAPLQDATSVFSDC